MLESLYENIWTKIKGLAIGMFVVETIGAIITGVSLLFVEDIMWVGLVTLFAGPIVAWVSSWMLYGFGELIEQAVDIQKNTRRLCRAMETTAQQAAPAPSGVSGAKATGEERRRCEKCGKQISLYPCAYCGHNPNAGKKGTYKCGKCGNPGPYEDACPVCGSTIRFFNN